MDSPIVLAAMDSPTVLAARALTVAVDQRRLAENLEAALQRERATVEALVAQRARLQSLLRQVWRHLRAGDPHEAQELLWPEDLDFDTEMSEDDDEEAAEDDDEDGALRCVLCTSSSGDRVYYTLAPEGPWAGLEPSARIVCGSCHDEDLGRVDCAATLRTWTAA